MTSGPDADNSPGVLPKLSVTKQALSVHRCDRGAEIPRSVLASSFFSITRTPDELSIVCDSGMDLESSHCETGWRAIKLEGPLDFSLIGILARIAGILAANSISIFAISTFETDYILLKEKHLLIAKQALEENGYSFISQK